MNRIAQLGEIDAKSLDEFQDYCKLCSICLNETQ